MERSDHDAADSGRAIHDGPASLFAAGAPHGEAGEPAGASRRPIDRLRVTRRSPLLDEAWRYWTSLREGAALPRRSALDPKAMRLVIGHAMILDQVRHGTVRVRLGGQSLERIMGMDVRGLPIRAFFDLTDRTRALDLIEQVFDTPASLELDLIANAAPGGLVTARMLVLPLLDAAGHPTKALAVMVTDRIVDAPPRRFSVTNATLVPVLGAQHATPARRREDDPAAGPELPTDLARPQSHELAEPAAPFAGRPSQVPWLRVVK